MQQCLRITKGSGCNVVSHNAQKPYNCHIDNRLHIYSYVYLENNKLSIRPLWYWHYDKLSEYGKNHKSADDN